MTRTSTGKRFEVTSLAPPPQPREQSEPQFELLTGLDSDCQTECPSTHRLYVTRQAMTEIANHIGWGQITKHNRVEQGGILLGQVFTDRQRGVLYGVVEAAIPGRSARGSSGYLEMGHDTWKEMLGFAEERLSRQPERQSKIIGWYHTHPNNLAVFMSGTDQATQGRLFSQDWQFAMVLNPQKRNWRAFFGREARECSGYVTNDAHGEASAEGEDADPGPGAETLAGAGSDQDEASDPLEENEVENSLKIKAPRLLWICFFLMLTILTLNLYHIFLHR